MERFVNLCLLHHAPGQGSVERGQTQRAILEDFDQCAACAKEQHRAELGILAAADDQLVAFEFDHGLDGDALEVLRADALAHGVANEGIGAAHGVGVAQVELHAVDI